LKKLDYNYMGDIGQYWAIAQSGSNIYTDLMFGHFGDCDQQEKHV